MRNLVFTTVIATIVAAIAFATGRSWDDPTESSLQNEINVLTSRDNRRAEYLKRVLSRTYPNPRLTVQLHSPGMPQPPRIYELQTGNNDASFGIAFNNLCLEAKLHESDTKAWTSHAKVAASFNCRFIHSMNGVDFWYFRYRIGGELLSTIDGEYADDNGKIIAFPYEGQEVVVLDEPELTVTIGPSDSTMEQWFVSPTHGTYRTT